MSPDRKSPALWQSLALTGACALLLALTASAQSVPPDHAKQMAAGLELFKSSVSQLLKEHCLECHGGSSKVKSDFDLATRGGLLKGGAEGKAIVVGNASQSRLVKLVSHAAEPHMPSKKPRLPDDAIRQISQWIDLGAPYDQPLVANAREVKDRSIVTEADKQFWSFQPLKLVEPPSLKSLKNRSWARTPVDQFILADLEKKRLTPNPPLDRRKLIRRVYFDLIGLPPTPEEVDAFVGDKSPRAYEELIDRLLASPHYGERWGRHWLDLARYGESHGYEQDYDRPFAYHYRDFVIRALNEDLPYDQFVQWQIAGDELAPDNPQAWFATGFLGAGTHATQITANQAEKERYDELDDKISTIGTAMLGLTIGCARCHDHKFDPITAKDYYALISTFTTTVRSDHDVDLDPARTRRLTAEFNARHQPLVEALDKFEKEQLPARIEHWLKSSPSLAQPEWLVLDLEGFRASGGYYGINSTKRLDDGSWLVSITAGSPDRINFTVKTMLTNLAALRFEALPNKSLPNHGPGWSKDGGFQLTGLTLTAKPLKGGGQLQVLAFTKKRSLTEAKGVEAKLPWSSGGKSGGEQVAVYELEKPAGLAEGTELAFTLSFDSNFDRNLIGRLRVSASASTNANLKTPAHVFAKDYETALATLGGDADKWKKEQREALARVHRAMDADWLKLKAAILDHERQEPRPQLVKAMVCSEGLPAIRLHTQGPDFYERTYLLRRGDLAQKQGEASQSFLQVLMRTSEKEKHWQRGVPAANKASLRSAMAHWITDVEMGAGHLLARVVVNRLWQHHLGRGLVATPSDFGATGARPTHPELLDWLARELIRGGWSLKHVHRLILTSAVYMQDCATDPKRMKIDPENRLWWHRDPLRLDAEPLRDSILAVSGQLDKTMFGPGTLDEGMKRRSIYFFIKRSKLIPWMTQFDWPDSLQSLGLRVNTTVAPQALLMMNNPQVRASAVDFARRVRAESSGPLLGVQRAYRLALGREPSKTEIMNAIAFLEAQAKSYHGDKREDPEQLAMADFCQTIFGLNEFIYIE